MLLGDEINLWLSHGELFSLIWDSMESVIDVALICLELLALIKYLGNVVYFDVFGCERKMMKFMQGSRRISPHF